MQLRLQITFTVLFLYLFSPVSWAVAQTDGTTPCVKALFGEEWPHRAQENLAKAFEVLEIHKSHGKKARDLQDILTTYAASFDVYQRYIMMGEPSSKVPFDRSQAAADWIRDEGTIYRLRSKSDGKIYLALVGYPGENLGGVILLEQSEGAPEIIGVISDDGILSIEEWRSLYGH